MVLPIYCTTAQWGMAVFWTLWMWSGGQKQRTVGTNNYLIVVWAANTMTDTTCQCIIIAISSRGFNAPSCIRATCLHRYRNIGIIDGEGRFHLPNYLGAAEMPSAGCHNWCQTLWEAYRGRSTQSAWSRESHRNLHHHAKSRESKRNVSTWPLQDSLRRIFLTSKACTGLAHYDEFGMVLQCRETEISALTCSS